MRAPINDVITAHAVMGYLPQLVACLFKTALFRVRFWKHWDDKSIAYRPSLGKWPARRDSNSRHPGSKPGALSS